MNVYNLKQAKNVLLIGLCIICIVCIIYVPKIHAGEIQAPKKDTTITICTIFFEGQIGRLQRINEEEQLNTCFIVTENMSEQETVQQFEKILRSYKTSQIYVPLVQTTGE